MERVFLSLGSNLGDRVANLGQAIRSLRGFAEITTLSHAYETEPVDFTAQPWFLNVVVALSVEEDTSPEAPQRLLDHLLALERAMGRRRVSSDSVGTAFVHKGPRVIDLDIVLYGNRVIRTATLTLPHPAMHRRRFVLQPLAEVAPEVKHPLLGQSAIQLLQALPEEGPLVRQFTALNLLEE